MKPKNTRLLSTIAIPVIVAVLYLTTEVIDLLIEFLADWPLDLTM